MAIINCIDVSYCQRNVDYEKVKSSGITAVIIRAGYGREATQKDTQFETHYKNAKNAGLKVGAYWYSYADSISDAKNEALACIECIKNKEFDLPIYYDLEDKSQINLGKTILTEIAKNFCETLKNKGYAVGVYANLNWFKNYLNYTELKKLYSIWLAQYNYSNDLVCDIWQNSSNGKIAGINGNVDTNIIFNSNVLNSQKGTTENMIKYGEINNEILCYKQHLRILKTMGAITTPVNNDGGFGDGTLKATKELQKVAGIEVDGIVGKNTINAVYTLENKAYSVLNTKIINAKKALS